MTACFQNFAAGLILAAVAAELFPLMLETNDKRSTWVCGTIYISFLTCLLSTITHLQVGVSAGFLIGFIVLNSIESVIEIITEALKTRYKEAAVQVRSRSHFTIKCFLLIYIIYIFVTMYRVQ